jgi:hypothetical protein
MTNARATDLSAVHACLCTSTRLVYEYAASDRDAPKLQRRTDAHMRANRIDYITGTTE